MTWFIDLVCQLLYQFTKMNQFEWLTGLYFSDKMFHIERHRYCLFQLSVSCIFDTHLHHLFFTFCFIPLSEGSFFCYIWKSWGTCRCYLTLFFFFNNNVFFDKINNSLHLLFLCPLCFWWTVTMCNKIIYYTYIHTSQLIYKMVFKVKDYCGWDSDM